MAKKTTTEATAPTVEDIDPAAYYRVEAASRFRFAGAGFGALSQTEVSGEVLVRLLASEHAAKVARWSRV